MIKQHADTKANSQPDRFGWYVLGIFVFALLVRGFHLWQIRTAPFFTLFMGDARSYDSWAQQIAGGDWLGNEVFYQAPLYPYFLGLIYTILERDPLVVRICQALIGALSCGLLALAGRHFYSRSVGLAAGLVLAVYAPAIFFDGLIQKSVLDLLFLCCALWLLSSLIARPRRSMWLWVGLSMGCLVLTRENALVFLAAVFLWLLVDRRSPGKERLIFAGVLLLGAGTVLLPVALRNQFVGGEFHLTTSQFGPNFYIGNNEDADGTYKPLLPGRGAPRYEQRDATELAERAVGKELTSAEVSWYWARRASDYIVSQPGNWLGLVARKFMLVWNATELVDTEDQHTYAEWSIPLRLTGYVCHFGVVAPLAVLGVWVTWPQRSKLWLLYLMLAAYAASVVMFYVFARYRYPLVPLVVLPAAAGLVQLRSFVRASSVVNIVACFTVTITMAVFCNWPTTPKYRMRAMTHCNIGVALVAKGNLDQAIGHYHRALQLDPDFAGAHNNLGSALSVQGRVDEAMSHYRQALQLDAGHDRAHYNLGIALSAQGLLDEAISHFRRALHIRPDHAEAHNKLGLTLGLHGMLDQAIDHYRQALQLAPDHPKAHYNLGNALSAKGKPDEAIDHYRQALRNEPSYADAHHYLGVALVTTGRLQEALQRFEEAARLNPEWPAPLNGAAWILATHPDPNIREANRAILLAERAARLTKHEDPRILDTLAAAYAAAGRFERAEASARAALALISPTKDEETADRIRRRLDLYRQAIPFIESASEPETIPHQ
ncbi:MAG: tetratricopeptide repeat protein [Phycisphaerae bacterium]